MSAEQKDKIRAEMLARRLYKFANSKGKSSKKHEMSQAQVTAAKVLIDKGKPSLQSVESRDIEEPRSEAEIMAQLRALLADPGSRAQIQAMLASSPTPVDLDVRPQQSASNETLVGKTLKNQ